MPLIASAFLSYLSGLLAGFAGRGSVVIGVVGVAVTACLWPRFSSVLGVALAFAAGTFAAAASRDQHRGCEHAVDAQHRWLVALEQSAAPGSFVHGRIAECAAVSISVDMGHAVAGSVVAVHGVAIPSRDGLLIQHASLAVVRGPGPLDRWRDAAGASIDATYGADAPLVRALVIADKHDLSPEIKDRFAAAGLAHVLCIAGLHVGIIALAVALVLQLLPLPRGVAAAGNVVIISCYVAIIGAPAPAMRAAVMLAVRGVSRAAQRPISPWTVWALGALAPVLQPAVALEAGYQLTVAGVAALIAAAQLARRFLPSSLTGWRREVVHGLLGSTLATIVSAPLVAWTFGRVSIIGPLSNLGAAPIMALLQPLLFLGLAVSWWRGGALFLADAAHPLLGLLDRVASTAAAAPFARLELSPTPVGAAIAGAFSIALIIACAHRSPGRALGVAGALLAILAWLPASRNGSGMTELHMIDVGQGDAIALRTPHGHWLLFDAGRAWHGGDAGRATVIPYLSRRGGALDAFILSHPHTDHVGGAASVIRALHPPRYYDAAFAAGTEAYWASLTAARETGMAWQRVHPGDSLSDDGVAISFLGPDSAWTVGLKDPNLASTIALVRAGDVRFLLVGDAERPEEDWLLRHAPGLLHADVLKVGHHGSNTSSSALFLRAVAPRLALVSVGAGNSYGHPTPATVAAISASGAQVLRTDELGTIVVRTDGHRIFVESADERWELAPATGR